MKIKTVHIMNFKNFEGRHKFDLNENINIFYAENGFGKSSFFDALEWCLTGEINRFKEYGDFNDEDIINYNKDEEIHNCSVKIEFSNGFIERFFNVENLRKKGNTQVKVEYIDKNGKKVQSNGKKYINNLIKNKDCIGINSLSNIKQTHILSQDQITNFINSENPKDRYQNVLSIMGIENKLIIDNLKDINKRLNQDISKLTSQIEKYDDKCEVLSQEKRDIDKSILIYKINNINIKEINSDIIVNLLNKNEYIEEHYLNKDIKDKLKLHSMKYQGQLSIIRNIKIDKYQNIFSLKNSNDKIIDEINELKYIIKSKLLDKTNLEKRISDLSNKEIHFQRIIKLKEQIKNKTEQIKAINISDIDIKNYNIINHELAIISYAIKYKPEVDQYTLLLKKCIEEKERIEKNIDEISKAQEDDKVLIKGIENKLSKTDSNELVDMIDSLEKIKKFFTKKNNHSTCPVCNSDITSIDILKEINNNIDTYKKLTNKLEGMTKELILSKNSLSNKINSYSNDLSELKKELNSYINKTEVLAEKIRNIIEDRLYQEYLFKKDINLLKSLEIEKRRKLEDINKYNKIDKEIKDIENKYKEDLELIGDESENIKDVLVLLNAELTYKEKEILEMKESEEKLNIILKENNEILYKLDNLILKEKYNIDITKLINEIEEEIKFMENKIKDLDYIYLTIEVYLFNLNKDKEIKNIKKIRESYENKVSLIIKKSKSIDSYINNLNQYSKQCIERYLNNSESPVKKYYNYLNPMPIKQSLHFNTNNEDEKLLIEIKYNGKDLTRLANKTLSSGQLNVLALSIFLAMNENQRMNELNMIAIDDPIQNMDDINQFSVCDILGNLEIQMIFSTHDIEFLKLFLKKNSYNKGSIRIFNIESPYLTPDKVKIIDNK
jgi:exonuclease SbcC